MRRLTLAIFTFAGVLNPGLIGDAAEIHFKPRHTTSGPLVTLGDVADIDAATSEESRRLAQIELFPAPSGGRTREVHVREIQDALNLKNVDLSKIRFSGASVVKLRSSHDSLQGSIHTAGRSTEVNYSLSRLRQEIVKHLQSQVPGRTEWNITLEVAPNVAAAVSRPDVRLHVSGGRPPWTGRQQFRVSLRNRDGVRSVTVAAQIDSPMEVVVAVYPLRRGQVVRVGDVELRPLPRGARHEEALSDLDAVVGKELVRAVSAGRAVSEGDLRRPILVRRGKVVEVTVQGPGVKITTYGKAAEDGSRGDPVLIEALDDRNNRFTAVVSDYNRVTLYAGTTRVTPKRDEFSTQAAGGARSERGGYGLSNAPRRLPDGSRTIGRGTNRK